MMVFVLLPKELLKHYFTFFHCFHLRAQLKYLCLQLGTSSNCIKFCFIHFLDHHRTIHFIKDLVQQFEKSSRQLILVLKHRERKGSLHQDVIEDWLYICFKIFSKERRDKSNYILEPRLELMSFDVNWSLFMLIQCVEHNKYGHIQCKRSGVGKNCHNFRHYSLIILHYYSSGDPVQHRQSLVMCYFSYLPHKSLFVLFGKVINYDILPPFYTFEDTCSVGASCHTFAVH